MLAHHTRRAASRAASITPAHTTLTTPACTTFLPQPARGRDHRRHAQQARRHATLTRLCVRRVAPACSSPRSTPSSGNHAQAIALACRLTGRSAQIVMPDNAPTVKRAAVEDYGATITTCVSTQKDREEAAEKLLQVRDEKTMQGAGALGWGSGLRTGKNKRMQRMDNLSCRPRDAERAIEDVSPLASPLHTLPCAAIRRAGRHDPALRQRRCPVWPGHVRPGDARAGVFLRLVSLSRCLVLNMGQDHVRTSVPAPLRSRLKISMPSSSRLAAAGCSPAFASPSR